MKKHSRNYEKICVRQKKKKRRPYVIKWKVKLSKTKHSCQVCCHFLFLFRTIKKEIRDRLAREEKLLESQKQDDLNKIKQTIEKEKEELKKKLQ